MAGQGGGVAAGDVVAIGHGAGEDVELPGLAEGGDGGQVGGGHGGEGVGGVVDRGYGGRDVAGSAGRCGVRACWWAGGGPGGVV